MRVLHVIYADPAMYPPTINACRLQEDKGFQVLVAGLYRRSFTGFKFGPGITESYLDDGSGIRPRRAISKVLEWYRFRRWIRRLVQQFKPDAIVGYDVHGFVAALDAAHKVPVLFHLHDLPPLGGERPVGRLYRIVASAARRRINEGVGLVVPEKSRLELVRRSWEICCPSLVVPNCAWRQSVKEADNPLRRRLGIDESVRVVIRAGGGGSAHLELETIDALKLVPNHIHLCLIGCGDKAYAKALTRQSEAAGVSRRVHIVEFVDYDTLRLLLPDGWVGLALYRKNSSDFNKLHQATASSKLMEYVAAGLPSVVSNADDFRSFASEYGCVQVARSESPEGIADAIRALDERPDVHGRLRERAFEAFRTELNYALQYEPVLRLLDNFEVRPIRSD